MRTPRPRLRARYTYPPAGHAADDWCRVARTFTWYTVMGIGGFGLLSLLPPLWLITFPLFIMCCAGLLLFALSWAMLVSVFYAKFSLAHFVGSFMWVGLCVSLCLTVEWPWLLLPWGMLSVYLFLAYFFIVMQDPGWGRFRPFRKETQLRDTPDEAPANTHE